MDKCEYCGNIMGLNSTCANCGDSIFLYHNRIECGWVHRMNETRRYSFNICKDAVPNDLPL